MLRPAGGGSSQNRGGLWSCAIFESQQVSPNDKLQLRDSVGRGLVVERPGK
ncbi:hypothetical protein M758_6G164800 [Ceratodon purpureus]|uniref:Uncharacterized protein n=1 Tax=Ceratodon purpureus TaxID=3225 RepID=A0A8T0HGS7_CERPU|nr:hypothetical protein KC19_6G171300 [Ceratodon purpureus]KAG0614283.1 hypothetical protein M758_6G164800 [Ceratodon purpureus]